MVDFKNIHTKEDIVVENNLNNSHLKDYGTFEIEDKE